MRPWQRNILDKHRARLVKEIKPETLMLFLMEKGIIPPVTREETRSSKKPEDINEALLTKLKYNSGTMAFNMLIKGLQNTDQASLACLLLEESQLEVIADRKRLLKEVRGKEARIKASEKKISELQARYSGYDELKKQNEYLKGEKKELKKRLKMFEFKELEDANAGNLNPGHRNDVSCESGSRKICLPGNDASCKEHMMDDKHRNILRRNRSALSKDLEPTKILHHLVDVLDVQDEENIKAKKTRKEASHELLDMLPRRGPKAFGVFKEALRKKQPDLAIYLEKLEEMQTQLNQERAKTADVRKENRKLKKVLQREQESHRRTKKECDQLKSTKEISKPRKKKKG